MRIRRCSGRAYSTEFVCRTRKRQWPGIQVALAAVESRLHAAASFRVIIIVMQQFRKRRGARGFSLIELLIVIAIILIILAIAVPKLGSARMNANEMAVIRELQTINTMQVQYMSQFQRFATTLAELGPPTSGGPGPQAADLIPSALSVGEKDGYIFTMTATPSGYTLNANPKVFNTSGRRTFFTDQNALIHQNWSAEAANASSPEFK
jgi:type IV pilus assembly protein PilA